MHQKYEYYLPTAEAQAIRGADSRIRDVSSVIGLTSAMAVVLRHRAPDAIYCSSVLTRSTEGRLPIWGPFGSTMVVRPFVRFLSHRKGGHRS